MIRVNTVAPVAHAGADGRRVLGAQAAWAAAKDSAGRLVRKGPRRGKWRCRGQAGEAGQRGGGCRCRDGLGRGCRCRGAAV